MATDERFALRALAAFLIVFLMSLSACDTLPRDPDGTLDKVSDTGIVRVGMIGMNAVEVAQARKMIDIVARRTGAAPHIKPATAEPAFAALDEGRLDIVIGRFEKDSPWKKDVAFGPPLARSGSKAHPFELKAAMRNGENRWIMLIEEASRQASQTVAAR